MWSKNVTPPCQQRFRHFLLVTDRVTPVLQGCLDAVITLWAVLSGQAHHQGLNFQVEDVKV